ncbi:MAG: hypothetical protein JWL98_1661 [Xanthomonadaceae bacterium]|nr:hypothetical protein [Xanthomonadaceae bacterium]
MNMRLHLSFATLLALASTTTHAQQSPDRGGALAVPANRIVGLWDTEPLIRPCGSTEAPTPTHTTVLFNTGGTWVESPRFPPGGIPSPNGQVQRSGGLGTWSYSPLTAQYTAHMRFDWYLDGAYDGYMTVDRRILLSSNGLRAGGPVRATRYAADGSFVAQLCGSASAARL